MVMHFKYGAGTNTYTRGAHTQEQSIQSLDAFFYHSRGNLTLSAGKAGNAIFIIPNDREALDNIRRTATPQG